MDNPLRWIFKSIRRKAIVGLLVILLSTVFLISLTIASQARKFIFGEIQRRTGNVARFVGSELTAISRSGEGIYGFDEILQRICADDDVLYISLFDERGKVLSSGCTGGQPIGSRALSLSEVLAVETGGVRFHQVDKVLEVYRPVETDMGYGLFLVIGFDVEDVDSIVSGITNVIAASAFVVYMLGLLVLVIAVNQMTLPIENLTEGMKDVGSGHLPDVIPVSGYDEVGTLTESFNRMIGDLRKSREEIMRYQRHLEDMVVERTEALDKANSDLVDMNVSLQKANEKLMELDKLKSNFLGIATHELRTPITVIEGYLDSLVDGFAGELNDQQVAIVGETLSSCHRMADLVSDMLDITRIEAGKMPIEMMRCSVLTVIDRVASQMAPIIKKKDLTLNVDRVSMDIETLLDEERILQVLVNLIGNATKFTPGGGVISVKAAVENEGHEPLVLVTVSDTGIGISAEDLPEIFDEFAQVGAPGKEEGTGLGLAICEGIIEAHGGRIWAESVVGQGSAFTFSIPLG